MFKMNNFINSEERLIYTCCVLTRQIDEPLRSRIPLRDYEKTFYIRIECSLNLSSYISESIKLNFRRKLSVPGSCLVSSVYYYAFLYSYLCTAIKCKLLHFVLSYISSRKQFKRALSFYVILTHDINYFHFNHVYWRHLTLVNLIIWSKFTFN